MCGFVGVWDPRGFAQPDDMRQIVARMRDRLHHRGPDDSGLTLDVPAGVALGFRRLAIIDLSLSGHQPMTSHCGRYHIVFNGEIYNHRELRDAVEQARGKQAWRGHSDTEVLLEAMATWGIDRAIERSNGMFAMAVWDSQNREMTLARDRLGKKPLYYGYAKSSFVFASEIKALVAYPGFDTAIDSNALAGFMQVGYLAGARSIFSSTKKLPAGTLMTLRASDVLARGDGVVRRYWDLHDVVMSGIRTREAGAPAHQEELESVLRDAVSRRMDADVPLGAFLSGGIDSSLITSLMTRNRTAGVRTFSIGFDQPRWDEAPHARAVANHLRTDHTEHYVDSRAAMAIIHELPAISDEPFADESMIPTVLLCRLARSEVTVALSGDGGDELFAGYERYGFAETWIPRMLSMPRFLRRSVWRLCRSSLLAGFAQAVDTRLSRRVELASALLGVNEAEDFYRVLMSVYRAPGQLLAEAAHRGDVLAEEVRQLDAQSIVDRLTYMDASTYLVGDILTKVDRASMAHSLEVRCPILDYRVAELAWRFMPAARLGGGVFKRPLRKMLYQFVPRALVDRPKMGFSVPLPVWLRQDMRDWAEDLMSTAALSQHGLLNSKVCRGLWEDYTTRGTRGWRRVLWNLIMFQSWHRWLAEQAGRRNDASGIGELPRAGAVSGDS